MRILLGDRTGEIRAEVTRGYISQLTWRLNKPGIADLFIDRRDPACTPELLRAGSRIFVELDDGLPPWGGVLELPRTWTRNMLQIRAHTIERLLSFAITPKTLAFYGVPVGTIFVEVLQDADTRAGLGLDFGQVWYGGNIHWPRYHFRDAMWVINESLRKMETCDYKFTPFVLDNKIRFRATLQEQLGDDKRARVALIQGVNVAEAKLTEQGDIVNRVAVVGSGSTWGERQVIYALEEASRQTYGLRERALTPSDVTQETTLNRYAETELRDNAYPHTLADLTAANRTPALFSAYDVGDIVRVQLPDYGFGGYDAPMRIMARGYDPRSKRCELVCDEQFTYVPVFQGEDETQPGEEDA